MRRILKWFVTMMKRLLHDYSPNCPGGNARGMLRNAEESAEPSARIETRVVSDDQSTKFFDKILNDCHLRERRVFKIWCRPIGFKGSDVICEVAKKYKIGTRITRSDGRAYAIYRLKKTKRTRFESSGQPPMWRAVA